MNDSIINNPKIFISAGESSGDLHGANLITCLLKKMPHLRFYGLGKTHMQNAGLHNLSDMSAKSLMWLHVLKELSTFIQIKKNCIRFLEKEKPCVAILIDYCGLNFHLAKAAKKLRIPIVYYISPQLWAHGPWRIKKINKWVDKLLVIYPFEKTFYKKARIPVTYVGHPLFDEIQKEVTESVTPPDKNKLSEKAIISILPGSRKQEITRLLPVVLKAMTRINQAIPSVKICVSCSEKQHYELIKNIVQTTNVPSEIITENVQKVIRDSDLCIAGSGTITLHIAQYHKPMIIIYKISPFAYFIAKPFMITPYIGLVNTLANTMIVPETLMYKNNYDWLADQAIQLLTNTAIRNTCINNLKELINEIGKPGASERAATEILYFLNNTTS